MEGIWARSMELYRVTQRGVACINGSYRYNTQTHVWEGANLGLMEYIDEVYFRMRRFFTDVAINFFFFVLSSSSCCSVVFALSKTIWSCLSSSHQVWNQHAIYETTSRSWVKVVELIFIRHITFLISLLKEIEMKWIKKCDVHLENGSSMQTVQMYLSCRSNWTYISQSSLTCYVTWYLRVLNF